MMRPWQCACEKWNAAHHRKCRNCWRWKRTYPPTKIQLIKRVTELNQRVRQLEEELYGPVDATVPFTAPETIPAGTTIMVRMPKRFRVHG